MVKNFMVERVLRLRARHGPGPESPAIPEMMRWLKAVSAPPEQCLFLVSVFHFGHTVADREIIQQ